MGYLNAKHPTWSCKKSGANGRILFNFISETLLTVVDSGIHTTRPYNSRNQISAIDLVPLKGTTKQPEIEILDELDSDHLPSILEFSD